MQSVVGQNVSFECIGAIKFLHMKFSPFVATEIFGLSERSSCYLSVLQWAMALLGYFKPTSPNAYDTLSAENPSPMIWQENLALCWRIRKILASSKTQTTYCGLCNYKSTSPRCGGGPWVMQSIWSLSVIYTLPQIPHHHTWWPYNIYACAVCQGTHSCRGFITVVLIYILILLCRYTYVYELN